jgi:hypothetical protein
MRQAGKKTFTTLVRGSAMLIRWIVTFTVVGLITSIVVVLLTSSAINRLCSAETTGIVPQCATSLALVLAIMVGFMVAFFLAGKVYGIQRILAHATGELKGPLASSIARNVLAQADRKGIKLEALGQSERAQVVIRSLQTLESQPRLIRWIGRAFLDRVDYSGAIRQFMAEQPLEQLSREQTIGLLGATIEALIDTRAPEPSLTMLWLLLGAAAALIVVLRITLGA